jgi:hypothetical protein
MFGSTYLLVQNGRNGSEQIILGVLVQVENFCLLSIRKFYVIKHAWYKQKRAIHYNYLRERQFNIVIAVCQ